jgi:hypothetical protein
MNRQRSPIAESGYQWLAKLSLRDRKQNPYQENSLSLTHYSAWLTKQQAADAQALGAVA